MSYLPYWIEHDENLNPLNFVWVKVPNIPANGSVILHVTKAPGFSPDGDSVFVFFDDFTSHNTSKWPNYGGTISIVNNTVIRVSGPGNGTPNIGTGNVFDLRDLVSEIHGRGVAGSNERANFYIGFENGNAGCVTYRTTSIRTTYKISNSWYTKTLESGHTNFRIIQHVPLSNGTHTINLLAQNRSFINSDSRSYAQSSKSGFGFYGWSTDSTTATFEVDWVIVRKYSDVMPTVSVNNRGSFYEVTVTNSSGSQLTDFQVPIPISSLGILSASESLRIATTQMTGRIEYGTEF